MFENLESEINELIEYEGRDLKFKIKDEILPLNYFTTPSISYDFLLLDSSDEYSFLNPEFNNTTSEEFPNLSDAQIYLKKLNEICKSNLGELSPFSFKTINPNKKIKEKVDFIFSENLKENQIPQFIEIKLYSNRITEKAPRIFGFIGNFNIIYILFYDPFHKIFNAKGKI
jgi:hypothetical protein